MTEPYSYPPIKLKLNKETKMAKGKKNGKNMNLKELLSRVRDALEKLIDYENLNPEVFERKYGHVTFDEVMKTGNEALDALDKFIRSKGWKLYNWKEFKNEFFYGKDLKFICPECGLDLSSPDGKDFKFICTRCGYDPTAGEPDILLQK